MKMKMIDSLIMEFEHEAQTTRKHLERLPSDKLANPNRRRQRTGNAGDAFFRPGERFSEQRGPGARPRVHDAG